MNVILKKSCQRPNKALAEIKSERRDTHFLPRPSIPHQGNFNDSSPQAQIIDVNTFESLGLVTNRLVDKLTVRASKGGTAHRRRIWEDDAI